jgi:hypothetical protein
MNKTSKDNSTTLTVLITKSQGDNKQKKTHTHTHTISKNTVSIYGMKYGKTFLTFINKNNNILYII